MASAEHSNPKGVLQERCIQKWHRSPVYNTLELPRYAAHEKHWMCTVVLPDGSSARADHVPGSKKDAEKKAAEAALASWPEKRLYHSAELFAARRGSDSGSDSDSDSELERKSGSDDNTAGDKTQMEALVYKVNSHGVKARSGNGGVVTLTGECFGHLEVGDTILVSFRAE